MSAVIEARALSKRAGRATLLDGVGLTVAAGEMVAIIGPNGAGKSTLLRLLSGDLRPNAGEVRLKQRDISSYTPRELAARRAMLSQHINVTFPFTVEEIVLMGAGERSAREAGALVDAALDEVGLAHFRERQLPTLSGGEQQRAHFARVLVQLACGEAEHGPGLLLLDEPTSSLDLRHQIDLVEAARRRAAGGTAVIAILHDLNLAIRFADRLVVLAGGKLAADGPRAGVVTREIIREIFEIDAVVHQGDDGVPYVLPQSMRAALLTSSQRGEVRA
ncbi:MULTISPECIES: heme ABC transporter ATP-binding protein [Bradyrhizobium]|uniref:Iron complex transport system ATP-binding protein n=1 Tax=Bradyrhizobium ottawaense TaxID=931866 RepID=A0ABV4FKH4_9BRAD|nr:MULTISPECIES: heme ABC transporter ATP-binding protein [Bradyrhizobium]MBR1290427.1 heme ABC transporter ATP-binding protein [Bradyrhizobium ottawaense]MDA9481917.1 iron ABC transporter [Bradyrhizobium sp. CCBAU 11445]PDT70726.1 heme ABC transporter ATP-binding protein [Bradyrhizobium ottawaense]WLB44828.1 heme ABC transporter ATP-binding protein [Bradyrhizobium ottawaense]WQN82125.1 heme ABC transporter ATP-binding protein [Bradyrhizobium ottawaense]